MPSYCIYLRKSRKDLEAEAHGEGETLARHRKILLDLAKAKKLPIEKIYEEIVSGETIASRPKMQELLSDVEKGMFAGVLVIEVERLARGDTIDQGIVAQAFKYSDTKIITPAKTFDPNNEFDEEYFEFGLFMSRREYKTINRRLQRGRAASAQEGKFVGSIAPYGYERCKIPNDKGYTLKIVPEQAEVVKLIFDLYVGGDTDENGNVRRMGLQQIARKLNEMGIPPYRHEYWQKETLRGIIDNPVYMGKIRWGWRKCKKHVENGKTVVSRPKNYDEDCILADGLHEAIVDEETFKKAQEIIANIPPPPVGYKKELKNPLSGLIVCRKCGRKMVVRKPTTPGKPDYLVCHARSCDNVSTPLHYVEERVLGILKKWVSEYDLTWSKQKQAPDNEVAINTAKAALSQAEKSIAKLEKQLSSLHDLLEQGVYSAEVFLERSKNVAERLEESKKEHEEAAAKLQAMTDNKLKQDEFIPKVKHLLEVYDTISTAAGKNELLKEVLEKAVYYKEKSGAYKGVSPDDFTLEAFPRVPKQS